MRFKYFIVSIIAIASLNQLCIAQKVGDERATAEIIKQKSAPIAATLYINEFPSIKDQFYNEWATGTITFENNLKAYNCKLRYNKWKDELIWLRETDYKTGVVIKETVKAFEITQNNNTQTFIKHIDTKGLLKSTQYLEILLDGNISLFSYRKCSYIKSSNVFSDHFEYYIQKGDELFSIKLKKSKILSLFTKENQAKLKALAKKNVLKFNKEDQLAKLLNLYNEQLKVAMN